MPVCAAVCDFFTDGAAVCTNMQTAAALANHHSLSKFLSKHYCITYTKMVQIIIQNKKTNNTRKMNEHDDIILCINITKRNHIINTIFKERKVI